MTSRFESEPPPDHLISPLEGKIVAASIPHHYIPPGVWQSHVQPMMPVADLYPHASPLMGWCADA